MRVLTDGGNLNGGGIDPDRDDQLLTVGDIN
jgi:hypothetical protein